MISFDEITINSLNDYDNLQIGKISELIDEETIKILKRYIGTKATRIIIEYPYYDSEYLSNYYNHYSQKFKHYPKECCRLHIENHENHLGYITLRPTAHGTKIGKTFLSPDAFVNGKAYLMMTDFTAHVLGQRLPISCFPWKKQEVDISCCAHTATWTVLKYFGNRNKNYSDTSIGEIVEKTKNDWGRKTPTMGLTPVQVSDILKEYGFSPIIIGKKNKHSIDEILAYIESGLPIVLFLNMTPENHAISLIGHGEVDLDLIGDSVIEADSGVILSSKLIKSVYAMDDRLFPYIKVPKGLPDSQSGVDYGLYQFDYAVVPLHARMQLSYKDVYSKMIAWANDPGFSFGEHPVCRIYITSSKSVKEHAFKNDSMNEELRNIILSLSMPRFVWCIDFADTASYKAGKTTGRIIIDSTSATLEEEPWILKHNVNIVHYRDFDDHCKEYRKVMTISPYNMYVHNLRLVEGDTE